MPEELIGLPERLALAMRREGRSLNATRLAGLAGCSTQVVTRALKGERLSGMEAASVLKMAKALGVRPGWLLSGEGTEDSIGVVVDSADAREIVRAVLAELGYEIPRPKVREDEPQGPAEDTK